MFPVPGESRGAAEGAVGSQGDCPRGDLRELSGLALDGKNDDRTDPNGKSYVYRHLGVDRI